MPILLVALAAFVAVAFWSLKPIFITVIVDRSSYGEVFVVAGALSALASAPVALFFWRTTGTVMCETRSLRGAGHACMAGVFLALWYYGFYRALFGSQKVDATVIAFTWPLIAIFAMRIFAPGHGRALRPPEYALVFIAFAGAVLIGLSNLQAPEASGGNGEILFAFVAAIGSGFYLPFAIHGSRHLGSVAGSKIGGTFYAVSIANLVSPALVSTMFKLSGHTLYFYSYDAQTVLICAMIGIGSYLLAEIT